MDLPAEIARHLDRLRDGLLEVTDLQGLYLYGSLTTGDHQDIWLQDLWVDFGLVTLARSAAVLRDGALISKSEAIGELAGFGVPAWLSEQIRRRREGGEVDVPEQQRPARARLVRRIMTDGIGRLTRPLREDPR